MGTTRPKSELDQEYRELVAVFLGEVWVQQKMSSQEQLAKALGVNRTTANRYLSKQTRPPLPRLLHLERRLGVRIPQAIHDAYWASESDATADRIDFEAELRRVASEFHGKTAEEQRAAVEELLARTAARR